MGVTYGRAKFHSSFLGRILEVAERYGIDPRELIIEVTEHDQVNAQLELVEEMARKIEASPAKPSVRFSLAPTQEDTASDIPTEAKRRAAELKEKARKKCMPSVLNIVVGSHEETHVSPFVETTYGCAISNVMLSDASLLGEIVAAVDTLVDYILLDPGGESVDGLSPTHAQILLYDDSYLWARATVSHMTQLLDGSVSGKKILVLGNADLVESVNRSLTLSGAHISEDASAIPGALNAVVALSPRTPIVSTELVQVLPVDTLLFDAGIGSLHRDALSEAKRRGLRVVRIDFRPTIAATAIELIHLKSIVRNQMGRGVWDGVTVVAGGLIGDPGDVIVDDFGKPTRIIGVADGSGGIEPIDEASTDIQSVRTSIVRRQLERSL
jgi:hypothetical protein